MFRPGSTSLDSTTWGEVFGGHVRAIGGRLLLSIIATSAVMIVREEARRDALWGLGHLSDNETEMSHFIVSV